MKNFNLEDASQVAIGSFALAVPVSFSEEAWRLGETLPTLNLVLIFALSIIFLSFFTLHGIFQGNVKNRFSIFIWRIVIAYCVAACVVALVLTAIDKFPLITDLEVAIKRLIIITMPASMGAIVVDSFDKE